MPQDTETLIIQLVLSNHLQEDYHSTAYSINVYAVPGTQCIRLTRLTQEAARSGVGGGRISMSIVVKSKVSRAKKKTAGASDMQDEDEDPSPPHRNRSLADFVTEKNAARLSASRKGKEKATPVEVEEIREPEEISEWEDASHLLDEAEVPGRDLADTQQEDGFDEEEVDDNDPWTFNLRDDARRERPPATTAKRKMRVASSDEESTPTVKRRSVASGKRRQVVPNSPIEVVELSSD